MVQTFKTSNFLINQTASASYQAKKRMEQHVLDTDEGKQLS